MKRSLFQKLTGTAKLELDDPAAEEVRKVSAEVLPGPPESSLQAGEETESAQEGQLTIDVYQTESEIVIKSTVAGVSPNDIDITITNDMITIRGMRERDEDISPENYYYQECYWGPFSRSVILPVDVEAEKVEASLKNGILTIRLPKAERERTKKIPVKSS